jgi:hypothetical protein
MRYIIVYIFNLNWLIRKKVVYGNFRYNASPIRRRNRSCTLFVAETNVTVTQWSECEPTASNYRNFEKIWSIASKDVIINE